MAITDNIDNRLDEDENEEAILVGEGNDDAIPENIVEGATDDEGEIVTEEDNAPAADDRLPPHVRLPVEASPKRPFYILQYTPLSLLMALILLWHTFRSRQGQFYAAVLYLSSSKLSYVILGNALVALSISFFYFVIHIFLNGLRSTEREMIVEGVRWSMTETCLALTMFREEVSINMVGMFLSLTIAKCFHWSIELRGKHIIQTEEAVTVAPNSLFIRAPFSHIKYVLFVNLLFVLDLASLIYCVQSCIKNGPSVHLLFGFESVILSLTAASAISLYALHVIDGHVNILHSLSARYANIKSLSEIIVGIWRDKRFTLTLTIDLFTHAGKFLSYLLFFFLVFTYYGMPINIFRDLYMSYTEFKKKIIQFVSYQRLNQLMSTQFETPQTEEELDGQHVCIICRDSLTVADKAKKLPGCGHIFHPYCLKGWLMQQQSCPTCRRDIAKASRDLPTTCIRVPPPPPVPLPQQPLQQEAGPAQEEPTSLERAHQGSPPQKESTEDNVSEAKLSKIEKSLVFPSLYTIKNTEGVNVYARDQTLTRHIPPKKIIVCLERVCWHTKSKSLGEMMLRMPDGWVREEDVSRTAPINVQKAKSCVETTPQRDILGSISSNQ